MSSPFTSYGYQPGAPHRGRPARPAYHAAKPPTARYAPYKPPCRTSAGRRLVLALAVVAGVPAALVGLLGLIVTGVATIPAVVGVLIGLALMRPRRSAPQRRRR